MERKKEEKKQKKRLIVEALYLDLEDGLTVRRGGGGGGGGGGRRSPIPFIKSILGASVPYPPTPSGIRFLAHNTKQRAEGLPKIRSWRGPLVCQNAN